MAGLVRHAEALLSDPDSARLDAEVLLGHVLGIERVQIVTRADHPVAAAEVRRYLDLVAARARGIPVAYLVGRREFWSMPLLVDEHTLVPRPETEHLVEAALELITDQDLREVLDLGTGSGAIALAIRRGSAKCRVTATDISAPALAIARRNAGHLGLRDIVFVEGDWYRPLRGARFDLIVSNPPYVPDPEPLEGGPLPRATRRLVRRRGRSQSPAHRHCRRTATLARWRMARAGARCRSETAGMDDARRGGLPCPCHDPRLRRARPGDDG